MRDRLVAFWDASALLPLCVQEPLTSALTALYQRSQTVVWWATSVELASGLARLARMRLISSTDLAAAHRSAIQLAAWWSVIAPNVAIRERAITLVERYDLRAADG